MTSAHVIDSFDFSEFSTQNYPGNTILSAQIAKKFVFAVAKAAKEIGFILMSCSLLAVSEEVLGVVMEGLLTPEEEGLAPGLQDEAMGPSCFLDTRA